MHLLKCHSHARQIRAPGLEESSLLGVESRTVSHLLISEMWQLLFHGQPQWFPWHTAPLSSR